MKHESRVPSEGDIRELSPSLADALLLARSVHALCSRHRSDLAFPLGREEEEEEEGAGAEAEAEAVDSQLWVNDKLSEVREENAVHKWRGNREWGDGWW